MDKEKGRKWRRLQKEQWVRGPTDDVCILNDITGNPNGKIIHIYQVYCTCTNLNTFVIQIDFRSRPFSQQAVILAIAGKAQV